MIGAFALFSGMCFIAVGMSLGEGLPHGGAPVVVMGALCLIVAVACFLPKSWPVTLRIIGGAISLGYAVYVVTSIGTPDLGRAVIGFVVIGLPFGFMAVFGKYPRWGRGAAALGQGPEPRDKPTSDQE